MRLDFGIGRQRTASGFVVLPVGASHGLGVDAFDDIQRWQDDAPKAQRVEDADSQHAWSRVHLPSDP